MTKKKNAIINVAVSILFKFLMLAADVIIVRFIIKFAGNQINGLNSLFKSIIGVLSLAELGMGTAITYCMYKPIADGDTQKIVALYCLFKKIYLCVGLVILGLGLVITPFLPFFASGYTMDANIYVCFLLTLASTVLSYTYSSGLSLINAYKKNYITTALSSGTTLLCYICQILVLYFTGNYYIYLTVHICTNFVLLILTKLYNRKHYKEIVTQKAQIDPQTKKDVSKNVGAMFMHKLGSVLVSTFDSLIISTFISVTVLGYYSNYITIASALNALLCLCFSPLTSIIGHEAVTNKDNLNKIFRIMLFINFSLGIVFFMGYFAIINPLITLFYGKGLLLDNATIIVITVNYFVTFMRQTIQLFRNAQGIFYYDRWKPFFEGVTNLVLSIICVKFIGLYGVILATIFTNLTINYTIEPHVLFKYGFNKKASGYYLRTYGLVAVFAVCLIIYILLPLPTVSNLFVQILINGFTSVAIAIIPVIIYFLVDVKMRKELVNMIKNWLKKKPKPLLANAQTSTNLDVQPTLGDAMGDKKESGENKPLIEQAGDVLLCIDNSQVSKQENTDLSANSQSDDPLLNGAEGGGGGDKQK